MVNKKYESFTRNDYKNWSKIEFILVGIFLVPLRLLFMLGYLIVAIFTVKMVYIIIGV